MSTQLQIDMLCCLGRHQLAYSKLHSSYSWTTCLFHVFWVTVHNKNFHTAPLFPINWQKGTFLLSSSPSSALSFARGIPFPLITRASNQLGANGPFPSCQIYRISLTTLPPSLPCGNILLAPLTHFPHYPCSPCVNIYHFNIKWSSSQLFPHLILIYFQVIH